MHLIRKLTAAAAALFCGLAAIPPVPAAAEEVPFSCTTLADGTVSVKCTDTSIERAEIPEEIDGCTVTALAENCFDGCTSLEEVTLPDTITTIEKFAFQNCASLPEIGIPAGVTKIGDFVFEGCSSLTAITVSEDNTAYCDAEGVLYTAGNKTLLRYPAAKEQDACTVADACTTIAPWAFTGCLYLKTVSMKQVTAIGADAFMNCSALQTVTLSEGITELIGASFARCTSLRSITMPVSLRKIGDRCFYGCAALEEIYLPEKLERIGEMAFIGCVGLKQIRLPASVSEIGDMGVGYTVDQDGNYVAVPGIQFDVRFGSYAHRYVREKGLPFRASLSQNAMLILFTVVLLAVLLVIGISMELHRRKKLRMAKEQEQMAQRRAARSERRRKRS